jgi:hypothetical protein
MAYPPVETQTSPPQGFFLNTDTVLNEAQLLRLADAAHHSETHNRFIQRWLSSQIRSGGFRARDAGEEACRASSVLSDMFTGETV